MSTEYEAVLGLEVHCQLKTNTKIFCGCSREFGKEPNTNVCPVCLGMPGVLPVLNKKAVDYAVKMGLATGCTINEKSVFSRKNYFYPDLPKGYQISQFDEPLMEFGHVDVTVGKGDKAYTKRVGLTRIHMEEDAGKSIHGGSDKSATMIDLNRAGTPLIEIVSEPDLRSAEEASAYFKTIYELVTCLDICDGNLEEGNLRCDVNISVRKKGATELTTRTELKNINSFKFVKDAALYEIQRQIDAYENGEEIVQETRLYDNQAGVTRSMRSKEEAHDYRYFPEPDLMPLIVTSEQVEAIRKTLPELPQAKRDRFVKDYKLPAYDAGVLTSDKLVSVSFEEAVKEHNKPKRISNLYMGDYMKLRNDKDTFDISDDSEFNSLLNPSAIASVAKMLDDSEISSSSTSVIFEEILNAKGGSPQDIAKAKDLIQVSDTGALEGVVDAIILKNPDEVSRFKGGEQKLMGFFVGQAMKETKGKGNPGVLSKLFKEKLS